MRIYSVTDSECGDSIYFPSMKAAREHARRRASSGYTATVERNSTGPLTKNLVLRLLNNEGWCQSTNDVETWEPVGEGKPHDDDVYSGYDFKIRKLPSKEIAT